MPPRNQTGNVQINKNEVDHKGEVQIDRQQNDQMHNPFHFQADQPMNNPLDMQADQPVNNVVVSREQIENEINTILRDTRRMARFQKVIACAALYDQADTEADKINSLFAIRESAANYLSQRKVTSSVERKVLCERLIGYIDSYARQNNLAAVHSVSSLLDGRHRTYDEIDNEITLAQSLVSDKPLEAVTKERRDAYRKKIEDVKTTRTYKADLEKWRAEKGDFLAQKIKELELHEGVNEEYDPACLDTVLWYGRANNLTDEAMVTMLKRMKADDDSSNLEMSIKARQIETVLSDILSWNMDDFIYNKSDDFLHRKVRGQGEREHFFRLYSKLQVAKNADKLVDELKRIVKNCDAPIDFSPRTLDELNHRIGMYKLIEKEYADRLSIMSSPYYALLQQADIEKAMTAQNDDALNAMKQEKRINGTVSKQASQEFQQYVDSLLQKKKRWGDTKLSDVVTRGSKAENAVKEYLKKKNIDIRERDVRLRTQIKELQDVFAQNLTEYKQQYENIHVSTEKEAPQVERQNINHTMIAVQGTAFVPVEKPDTRMGFFGKLKNIGLVGARWMIGATLGTLGTIVGAVMGANKQFKEKERVAASQKKRIHGIVPGTKDERFADDNITDSEDEKDILFDIRRAPLVWEKISAGDPEEPPQITIMTKQSIRGSRATTIEDIGHAMIGLSYSRFNKLTGRKERYKLMMGFYPGPGMQGPYGTLMMATGALQAGQLRNDSKHEFDIARKYTVKPGDINRIIRASETYADGGYGFYKRNCATYVADMARLANLPIADETVEEEIGYKGLKAVGASLGTGIAYSAYTMSANNIADKFEKNDMSYQNFGQKITTKEDLDRYYDTATKGDSLKKGYSPGAMGEDLRAS